MGGVQRQAEFQDLVEDAIGDLALGSARQRARFARSQHQNDFILVGFEAGLAASDQIAHHHVAVLALQLPPGLLRRFCVSAAKPISRRSPFFRPSSARISGVGSSSSEIRAAVFLTF